MKRFFNLAVIAISLLVFAGCSKSNNNSSVPEVRNPNGGGITPIDPGTGSNDPRLPDLSKSIPFQLTDSTGLSGLNAIAGIVYPPLVGDPMISMKILQPQRNTAVGGGLLVSFEDAQGFWGAAVPAFDGTGYLDATRLDMIFADDEIVLRTTGAIISGKLYGNIYYRVRQAGDNQCKKVVVTCQPAGPVYPGSTPNCDTTYDTVTPCQNYMNSSDSNVKQLGSFQNSNYSSWVTLQ